MESNLPQLLMGGLMLGGIYSLVAMGLTLIFGVVRVINFAHGELLMVAMYLSYWLYTLGGIDPYVGLLILIPAMFLVGRFIQRVLIQPVLGQSSSNQILITIGLVFFLQNTALFLWSGTYRSVNIPYLETMLSWGAVTVSLPRLLAFLAAIVMALAVFSFLKWTYLGKAIRAVAQDRRAAQLMGIDVHRIYQIAFGIGAACVGAAAALLLPIFYVYPTVGVTFNLTAFVIVVLGGMGNLWGAWIGGLIIGLVEALSGFFVSPALKEAIYLTIFFLVLIVRPQGLFGKGRGYEEVGFQ